ncbi:zinc knuckle CX2CX4HX4C containing protein [Tanacetum coccineum]
MKLKGANNGKFKECKTICTEDGSPLYTPFYYSPEEIEYFSAKSRFLDNKKHETDNSGMVEALAALEATLKIKKRNLKKKIKVLRFSPKSSTPKEQDPGSFILLCSIEKLDFNNVLADLGASISVMPLSMYKHLGIGKLEPINMVIEMAYNTKCTPKGIVENLLIKIDKFIFLVDFVILDMVEDLSMPIILGRPLLATAYAKVDIFRKSISLEVGSEKGKNLKDHWRERFEDEEDDLEENLEDPEECREDKANAIMGTIHDKLNDDWFNNTSEDQVNLEGILDYLEPRSYDRFIDLDDEAYNKRMCKLLRMTYVEQTPILITKVKVTRYTIGPSETYTKVKVLGVDEILKNKDNIAEMRARLMEKIANEGNGQAKP